MLRHTAAYELHALQGRMMLNGAALLAAFVLMMQAPIAQPLSYHSFHDARALFGVPNFWNVVTNLPFLIIGGLGFRWALTSADGLAPGLRRALLTMFAGVAATGLGSAVYHWSPDNATLVWDRLPIAVTAAAFYAAVAADRISDRVGLRLLYLFVPLGVASVVWWAFRDDLRPYLFVQFFPIVGILMMLWRFEPRVTQDGSILVALGLYVLAKVFESADGLVFSFGEVCAGHALKHMAAAAALLLLYRMFRRSGRAASGRL